MTISGKQSDPQNPLGDLEEWEDFVKERYPEPADKQALVGTNPEKTEEQFRDYEADARSSVREFYRLNHRGQTLDFVRQRSQPGGLPPAPILGPIARTAAALRQRRAWKEL